MNAFYNQKVDEFGRTIDSGASSFELTKTMEKTMDRSFIPPLINLRATTDTSDAAMLDNRHKIKDSAKNFDKFNSMYRDYLQKPQDNVSEERSHWGPPAGRNLQTYTMVKRDRTESNEELNINARYVQAALDLDDQTAHS